MRVFIKFRDGSDEDFLGSQVTVGVFSTLEAAENAGEGWVEIWDVDGKQVDP